MNNDLMYEELEQGSEFNLCEGRVRSPRVQAAPMMVDEPDEALDDALTRVAAEHLRCWMQHGAARSAWRASVLLERVALQTQDPTLAKQLQAMLAVLAPARHILSH